MRYIFITTSALALCAVGCTTHHTVETHHKIDPIHITVDVNLKVERELNNFFGDLDQESSLIEYQEIDEVSGD